MSVLLPETDETRDAQLHRIGPDHLPSSAVVCMGLLMPPGPALTAALRATTLEVARAAGRYDAVVIGAGAAGGLAALLLTEAGLRVLVLDAGAVRSPIRSLSRRLTRSLTRRILGAAALSGPRPAAARDPNSMLRVAASRRRHSSMILTVLMLHRRITRSSGCGPGS